MATEEEIKELFDRITGVAPDIKMEKMFNGRVKIDINFPLENFFIFMILVSIIAFFTVLLNSQRWSYLSIPVILSILSILLLKKTDNYYIIDTINKKIIYHFSFLNFIRDSVKYSFSEILCLTVDGNRGFTMGIKYWSYHLTLVTVKGELIPLSEPKKNIDLSLFDETASRIAEMINVPYKKGIPESKIRVSTGLLYSISDIEYIFEQELDYKRKVKFLIIIAVTIIALILLFINRNAVL
ncbi:MAG TPA: hypothetical protein P5120_14610 [Spirochaetota bacterium]|nr:hypothetical protein [Spirochaetota bacterium]HPF07322.1 hypothetical protein [Spirochaetota bacterium]HPJ43683.1 hypothetical protein [Spirochaetota bacterium]HPR37831.1 hypothetical protein [Spirochaetota bacterium]HRX48750.1 hypothetical protein [Spirochaetota bacterium]